MVKGFDKLTRVSSQKQALLAHAISHSSKYQKAVGMAQARKDHNFLVKHYIKNHHSPF